MKNSFYQSMTKMHGLVHGPRKDDSGPWTRPCFLAFIIRGENLDTKTGVGRTPKDK